MKWVLAVVMTGWPRVAAAACEHGAGGGGCSHEQGCGRLAVALMAGVAALGYWVLRHADKDAGAVRWAGRSAGWVLLTVGLIGLLCGSLSHVRRAVSGARQCGMHGESMGDRSMGDRSMGMMLMPPGHPPVGEVVPAPAKPPKTGDKKAR